MKLVLIGTGIAALGPLFAFAIDWLHIDLGIWQGIIAIAITFAGFIVQMIGGFTLRPPRFRH